MLPNPRCGLCLQPFCHLGHPVDPACENFVKSLFYRLSTYLVYIFLTPCTIFGVLPYNCGKITLRSRFSKTSCYVVPNNHGIQIIVQVDRIFFTKKIGKYWLAFLGENHIIPELCYCNFKNQQINNFLTQ